jgi:hypothetical protein
MANLFKKLWLPGILLSFACYFWYIFNGEAVLSSDIARDYLLFSEITQKKIILIGPKSSVMGIFHGPLWLYLNYPAYFLGKGNPVLVEVFWIILAALFTYSCYFVGKKLFNKNTGYLFSLMVSVYMFFHINQFFNPMGAMFLIPINFYLFVKYLEKYQIKYLVAFVLISGLIIQFELAIGIPFFALSVLYLLIKLVRSKHKKHLFAVFLIVIPLLNYIAFDLRHEFLLTNSIARYLSPASGDHIKYNYLYMLYDRTKLMITNIEILRDDPLLRNALMGAIFIFFLIVQFKNHKYRKIYSLFLYFYVGFFAMTLINKGPILYFYLFPLFPFVFLIFASFITSKYSKTFFVIFMVIYLMNLSTVFKDINSYRANSLGKTEISWRFLNSMAKSLYLGNEKEFGYFIYTPDIIAYAPKYALFFEEKQHKDKNPFYFEKKAITYIVVAPPAKNNPYLSYTWWKEKRLNITKKPVKIMNFENGYKIEKYELDNNEINTPFDHGVDPGLSFR